MGTRLPPEISLAAKDASCLDFTLNTVLCNPVFNIEINVLTVLSFTSLGAISILVNTIKNGIPRETTIPKCSFVIR